MKTLLRFISIMIFAAIPARATIITFNVTNSDFTLSTNTIKIIPVTTPINADGTFGIQGVTRLLPLTNGFAAIQLMKGNYLATNSALGGLLFSAPDDTNTHSVWQKGILISGFNTYNYTPGVNMLTSTNASVNIVAAPNGVFDLSISNISVSLAATAIGAVTATNFVGVLSITNVPTSTNSINSTNFWGLLSPTNLPAGLSSSNYVGKFTGDASGLTNLPPSAPAATSTNSVNSTNFWGQLSPTNLPAGLSSSNYVGTFTGSAAGLTNSPFATNTINSTNFWGLLSPTNLPAGLSSSNFVGTFAGNAALLTNTPSATNAQIAAFSTNALMATNAITATNGAPTGFSSTTITNSGMIQSSNINATATVSGSNVVAQLAFANLWPSSNLLVSAIAPTNGGAGKVIGWTSGGAVWTNLPASLASSTNTFYVSPTGNASGNGTRSSPWDQATGIANGPNIKLVFLSGNYTNIYLTSAASNNGLYLQSELQYGARVVGSPGFNGIANANNTISNITIDGFEVVGSAFDGVQINGDGCTVRNCWIHKSGSGGVFGNGIDGSTSGIRNYLFEANLIEYNGTNTDHDHGIYVSGTNGIIRRNVIRYNVAAAIQNYSDGSGSTANQQCYGNLCYGNNTANGFEDTITVYPTPGATNWFYGNTVISTNRYAFGGPSTVGTFGTLACSNNIFIGPASNGAIDAPSAGTTYSFGYNATTNSSSFIGPNAVITNFAGVGFVAPSLGLYWITPSSAARSAATPLAAGAVDFFGRPQISVSDIGAFQYNSGLSGDYRSLDPTVTNLLATQNYWITPSVSQSNYYGAFIGNVLSPVTNSTYSQFATNLLTAASPTNLAVQIAGVNGSPSGKSWSSTFPGGSYGVYQDTNGTFNVNDLNANTVFGYSGAPYASENVFIAKDNGNAFFSDRNSTKIYDGSANPKIIVATNRIDVTTNINVPYVNITNNLTVGGSITGATLTATSGTIGSLLAVPVAADNLTVTNGITNSALTSSTVLVADGGKKISSLANGSVHNLLHTGPSGASYSPVVEADLLFGAGTTADASSLGHGLMPQGDGNANHFYNGNAALTTIPDGALSANVSLDSAANVFSAANSFAALSKLDSLVVTNGFTNQSLTANSGLYADGNKRMQSIPAGTAGQYLTAGNPPVFATIQASQISGTIPFSGVASAANALTSGAPGTNNVFWTDSSISNALYVTGKWITMSNAAGTVQWNGGNQTNSGLIQATQYLGPNGQTVIGGSGQLSAGYAVTSAGATLTANSGFQGGEIIQPTIQQSGSAAFSALQINPTVVSGGSGVHDILELLNGGTQVWNTDTAGNQTNAGSIKASGGFIGTLSGNASTATSATSASTAGSSTTLVTDALTTNLFVKMVGNGGSAALTVEYPSGANALTENTNGEFIAYDTSGTAWIHYSGAPTASDSLILSLHAGNILVGDAASATTTVYDSKGDPMQTLTKSLVTVKTNLMVAGPFNYWRSPISKTANYSLLQSDSGSSVNNNGAVGATTNTLPTSWAGGTYRFTVIASQTMAAKASGSDTIAAIGAISSAGGLIFSSTPRATIDLECQVAGQWLVVGGSTNTWAFQ